MDPRPRVTGGAAPSRAVASPESCSELKSSGVYPPSEDTFLLVSVLEGMQRTSVAAEVGCGSGLATLELSKKSEYVVAADVSYEAAEATQRLLRERAIADVIVADRLSPLRDRSLDSVVCNPPYLPCNYCEEPLWCGGETGVEFASGLAEQARSRLREGGFLILVLSSLSDIQSFLERAESLGFETSIVKTEGTGLFERLYILRCSLTTAASDASS